MTREEAKEIISRPFNMKNVPQDILEAHRMAIKALEEQKPKTGHWIMPVQDDGMSEPIYYQVRCSECGFDVDPQIWYMEFQRYGADKYCPKCGKRLVEPQERGEKE